MSSPKETHPFPRKFISRAITSLAFLLVLTLPFVSVVQVYLWADEYVFPFSLIRLALWILRTLLYSLCVRRVLCVLGFEVCGGGGRAGVILCWVCACAWFHTEVLLLSQFPFPICWSQRLTRREYSVCGKKKEKKIPYLYFINVVRLSLFLVFVFALCPIDSSKHSGCAVVEPLPWYTQVSEVQLKNGYLQSQLQVQKMYAHLFPYFISIAFPVR